MTGSPRFHMESVDFDLFYPFSVRFWPVLQVSILPVPYITVEQHLWGCFLNLKKKISCLSGEGSSKICSIWHITRAIFANLCIMVWIHMVAHEYIYNFSNFKYFLYFWWTGFVIRFFPGFVQVLIRFRFSGSVGLTTGSVFVTFLLTHHNKMVWKRGIIDLSRRWPLPWLNQGI